MLASFVLSAALAAAHPHLYFSAADQAGLRQAATTTHQEMAQHILGILAVHLNDPAPLPTDYDDPRFFGNQVAVWAFAYQMTGNTAYAAKARTQLLTYLGWSDWGFGEIANLGEPDLNIGHMLLGTAAAYDWIYETLSPADRQAIATRIGTEADRMYVGLPNAWYVDQYVQNHNWINTAGLGVAALALQGEDSRSATWLSYATGNLQKLQAVIGAVPDGTFHEGIGYEGYGLAMSLPFWAALAHAGTDLTDLGMLRGFGKMFLYEQLGAEPNHTLLTYGDFGGWVRDSIPEILRYSAARFRDGTAEAAAQRYLSVGTRARFLPELYQTIYEFIFYDPTVAAADPSKLSLQGQFPDLGASILKSTWDSGDLAIGLKATPYGGYANFARVKVGGAPGGWLSWGHDHNDDMSFWMYGNKAWLAPEANGYTAGNNVGVTNPANTTAYHNGLLIDGQGQLGDVRASDSNWNNPWFFQRTAQPLLDATGTADYAAAGARGAQLFDAALGLTRWDRVIVLARSRYALVRDDIAAASAHAFDWTCHFSDGANVDLATGWIQGVDKSSQTLGVRVIAPSSFSATTGSQTATHMDLFDPDGQTAWVRVRPSQSAAQVQFLTALVPMASSAWAQRPTISALAASDAGAGAVVSPGSSLEERVVFNRPSADGKSAGDLVLTGGLVGIVGRDAAGQPRRAALFGFPAKIADQSGARELLSTQTAHSIEADVQSTTLVVTGEAIADFRAFAPGVSKVVLNGVTVQTTNGADGTVAWSGAPSTGGGGGSSGGGSGGGGGGSSGGGASPPPARSPPATVGGVTAPHVAAARAGCSTAGTNPAWLLLSALGLCLRLRRRR